MKNEKIVFNHLDFVIISSRDEERLLLVEVDAADRTVVFVKLLQQGAHTVVPQLQQNQLYFSHDQSRLALRSCV